MYMYGYNIILKYIYNIIYNNSNIMRVHNYAYGTVVSTNCVPKVIQLKIVHSSDITGGLVIHYRALS